MDHEKKLFLTEALKDGVDFLIVYFQNDSNADAYLFSCRWISISIAHVVSLIGLYGKCSKRPT